MVTSARRVSSVRLCYHLEDVHFATHVKALASAGAALRVLHEQRILAPLVAQMLSLSQVPCVRFRRQSGSREHTIASVKWMWNDTDCPRHEWSFQGAWSNQECGEHELMGGSGARTEPHHYYPLFAWQRDRVHALLVPAALPHYRSLSSQWLRRWHRIDLFLTSRLLIY